MTVNRWGPDIFGEHPIRTDVQDPLALPDEVRLSHDLTPAGGSARPRIGFACQWHQIPERTWSYSAWNLRERLRVIADTADVGVQLSPMSRTALKAIHTRYRGRFTTTWSYSRLTEAYNSYVVRSEFSKSSSDAVLMIQDVAVPPAPFFVYSDTSYDLLISATQGADVLAAMKLIRPSTLARLRARQVEIYERAAGVITMSRWFARSLVEQTGLPPHKVHVVHPGNSFGRALSANGQDWQKVLPSLPERPGPRRRLLFIGRVNHDYDFYAKGGDLALAALDLLRRDYDPQITLTLVGPDNWPLADDPPAGVRFLGSLPPDKLAELYDSHDLFVMPSRMEGFGIVFTEAQARGLPCIGRYACAMPEIVTPGVSGALISGDDPHELADTIASALADDALYESCYKRASQIAAYFSWDGAAREVVHLISQTLGCGTP